MSFLAIQLGIKATLCCEREVDRAYSLWKEIIMVTAVTGDFLQFTALVKRFGYFRVALGCGNGMSFVNGELRAHR
jgi:hypothetical protein